MDGVKLFTGNEYTAFGTAIHYVCENAVIQPQNNNILIKIFHDKFNEEINKLTCETRPKLISDMKSQGENLIEYILPNLTDVFGDYEVISVEERLLENMIEFDFVDTKFKGFIDLVIKTTDGKYHIIDWKTCSWGWDAQRKSDPMTVYQLSFYKRYFSNKHNIDEKNIETYFALLKRTAKSNKVEIFRVTNGPRRIKNAMQLLEKALIHINNKNYIKNRLSCKSCEYYKTKHCT